MNTVAAASLTQHGTNAEWADRKAKSIARGEGQVAPVFVQRARNSEVWDVEGNRYIDFASGIAVCNTGHMHPKVHRAVNEQLERFSHTCIMVTPYDSAVLLAEKINNLAPGPTPKKTMFVTTGAEAVENAVKIARSHTGRRAILAFDGGYHGRTNMTMGLTGKMAPYKSQFGPFPADVHRAPFPIEYHGISVDDSIKAIEKRFKTDLDPEDCAAIIVEPVQGEGGFYPASPEFLKALRALCDKHGILLILDEIQSGFGRTGKMFACEKAGIEPDLITFAKGVAGGFPLAGVVGNQAIMDAPNPGGLGGTYAGSPVACAAALAVLEVIEEENLCKRAEELGALFAERLNNLQSKFPDQVGDVRASEGAMIAIELVSNADASSPAPQLAKAVLSLAYERGLIALTCGFYGNVFRFLPPLTISDALAHEGLDVFESCFQDALK
jgi:4-aminobutyrate aminotransferase/(S)-3-amino-2-methylpropionate transaminase